MNAVLNPTGRPPFRADVHDRMNEGGSMGYAGLDDIPESVANFNNDTVELYAAGVLSDA